MSKHGFRRTILATATVLAVSVTVGAFASAADAATGTIVNGATANGRASNGKVALPRFGDSSPEVARLQQAIMARGFTLPGGVTGTFNASTRTALRSLQKVAGFKASGVVDARTAKFLGLVDMQPVSRTALPAVGQSGDAVWSVQQALINKGVPVKGGADGKFGTATARAIAAFQKKSGIAVTSRLDEATAVALGLVAAPKPVVTASVVTNSSFPKFGDKGDVVRTIQHAMMRDSIGLPGGVDGHFGNATRAAIAEFQKRRGLAITGEIDQATMNAITALVPTPVAAAPAPAPAAAAGITIDSLPTRGQSGDPVRSLQQALVNNGIAIKGGVDGVFGVATAVSIGNFQTARGLAVTNALDAATAAALGLIPSLEQLGLPSMKVFPMQGRCSFVDSWGEPRSGGRKHEGTDLIGPRGLAIYAVVDGVISKAYTGLALGGNSLRLTMPDGTYFFYSHLDSFAPGIAAGVPVRAGQIIGYNGSTGNAGSPHLHFEVHPRGGAAVNPYPLLKAIDGCNNTNVLPQ
jgi:peptidoglycan hydrolase-like protein with peptidoglycan-binding domain